MLKDGSVKNESQETSLDRDATSTPEHSRREHCCQSQGINLSLNDWSRILTRVSTLGPQVVLNVCDSPCIDSVLIVSDWISSVSITVNHWCLPS
jgi:hypothetical protein